MTPMLTFFRNKKSGLVYAIVGRAVDATNSRVGTNVVIYREVSTPGHMTNLFVREQTEFDEKFEPVGEDR